MSAMLLPGFPRSVSKWGGGKELQGIRRDGACFIHRVTFSERKKNKQNQTATKPIIFSRAVSNTEASLQESDTLLISTALPGGLRTVLRA